MPMKSEEWIQYVTGQLVDYIETPKAARKKRKPTKEKWSVKWFGVLPMSIDIWSKNTRLRHVNWKRLKTKPKLKRNPRI